MKIVHFSDPHLGLFPRDVSAFFDKRIVGALNFFLLRRRHFDWSLFKRAVERIITLDPQVVVLTGDITSMGTAEEFALARHYLKPLVEADLKLIYVPGNHDAYVAYPSCREALFNTFLYLNQHRCSLDELPLSYCVGDVTFQIFNEALPTPLYRSSGVLTDASVELLMIPKRDSHEVRIGVGHFPTRSAQGQPLSFRRKLKNSDFILSALEESRLAIYLCGHIHHPFINRYHSAMEICSGSISQNGHLNVLEINQVKGTLEQHWEIVKSDPNLKNKIKTFAVPKFSSSGSQASMASGSYIINLGTPNRLPFVNGDHDE
jgi:DNA repair exonuclease SbcCD nuclease subunit